MAYTKMTIRQPAAVAFEFLMSFPIACFSLTVLTDIAYWQTENLLWLHFSEWLLLAGLVFGCLAGILALVGRLLAKKGPTWLTFLGLLVVGCLAALNSFIHTADGWTAVVPYGLAVSVATALSMIFLWGFGQKGKPHA